MYINEKIPDGQSVNEDGTKMDKGIYWMAVKGKVIGGIGAMKTKVRKENFARGIRF